jgi:hypothetical protein
MVALGMAMSVMDCIVQLDIFLALGTWYLLSREFAIWRRPQKKILERLSRLKNGCYWREGC